MLTRLFISLAHTHWAAVTNSPDVLRAMEMCNSWFWSPADADPRPAHCEVVGASSVLHRLAASQHSLAREGPGWSLALCVEAPVP